MFFAKRAMKKESYNPVYDFDLEDGISVSLGDPRLTEAMRLALYEIGNMVYGLLIGVQYFPD